MTDPIAPIAPAPRNSPGAAIRAARTQARLSIDELVSRTRISRHTLEAMEADAFDKLLEPVYVRGYYRKCAKVLGLPEKPLIEAYDAMYTPPVKPTLTHLSLASGGDFGSTPPRSRLGILVLPLAIAIAAVIWLWTDSEKPAPAATTFTVIDPLAPSAPVVDPRPAPATPSAEDANAGANSEFFAAEGETVIPSAETPDASAQAASAAAGSAQVVLVFNAISFARVEDASGKSLLSGVISAGERKTLQGQPPYTVVLGNATAVTVEYAGKPVDLKPYVKPNSPAARFILPPGT